MDNDKIVDESWKDSAAKEKETFSGTADQKPEEKKLYTGFSSEGETESTESTEASAAAPAKEEDAASSDSGSKDPEMEVNFLNYITSLGYQALIFLGEIAHPMSKEMEKNLPQSKFLIDTLAMMKDKTKGNLTPQEENMLEATVYELQLKYVDAVKKDKTNG